MANERKGASLAPEDHAGGGQIPDGEYTITECYTGLFDYAGQVPEGVPAIIVGYKSADGQTYDQPYKAGDNDHLIPSEDHERFEHPAGGEARIYKGGAASQWLGSLVKAGVKVSGDSVKQFKGLKVVLVNVAAPKGRGDDAKAGKVIPLVSKLLGKGAVTTSAPKAAPVKASAPAAPATTAPATASPSNGDGDLTAPAIELIQTILGEAPDNTISRVKLATQVMLKATKDAGLKAHMVGLKKLAGDSSWLIEQAETGQWTTDGETIQLGG